MDEVLEVLCDVDVLAIVDRVRHIGQGHLLLVRLAHLEILPAIIDIHRMKGLHYCEIIFIHCTFNFVYFMGRTNHALKIKMKFLFT